MSVDVLASLNVRAEGAMLPCLRDSPNVLRMLSSSCARLRTRSNINVVEPAFVQNVAIQIAMAELTKQL